ncbi:MAG: glucose-6-phosphate isomerase [Anaerosomatales bacterium]
MNAMERLLEADAIARLADRDPTLFTDDVDQRQPILKRLGWTDLAEKAATRLPLATNLAAEMAHDGVTDVVLLGMGGSSLAPLVMSEVLGPVEGAPALHVLDTASPSTVNALISALDPHATAFVLASKSGTTIEPLSLYAVFREWMDDALGRVAAGKRFIVVTDPGSPLEARRQKDVMRVAIAAPPNVGGRFSALSVFGLVPAGLAGLDIAGLASHALEMERVCHVPAADNPGAELAAWMFDALAAGRDKLTLVASPEYGSFGLWVEQLVAESTGKQGAGILPVIEDGSVPVPSYGSDRALVVVRTPDDPRAASHAQEARDSGLPVMEYVLAEPLAIGGEFVRWEFAVALTGFLMGVNPFDEPNVAEGKAATNGVLDGSAEVPPADADIAGTWVTAAGSLAKSPAPDDIAGALALLRNALVPGTYLAVLAYLPDDGLLAPIRGAAADVSTRAGVPVCVEVGPRYLHSTGQLHKGGPETGVFLILTARSREDRAVPGADFSLGQLYRAQAEGDLMTLAAHGRPVVRLDLPDEAPDTVATVGLAMRATVRTG